MGSILVLLVLTSFQILNLEAVEQIRIPCRKFKEENGNWRFDCRISSNNSNFPPPTTRKPDRSGYTQSIKCAQVRKQDGHFHFDCGVAQQNGSPPGGASVANKDDKVTCSQSEGEGGRFNFDCGGLVLKPPSPSSEKVSMGIPCSETPMNDGTGGLRVICSTYQFILRPPLQTQKRIYETDSQSQGINAASLTPYHLYLKQSEEEYSPTSGGSWKHVFGSYIVPLAMICSFLYYVS